MNLPLTIDISVNVMGSRAIYPVRKQIEDARRAIVRLAPVERDRAQKNRRSGISARGNYGIA